MGRHVDRLKFLDIMLGDRPPLTPPQLVYQRMLAGDPIEAAEQAHDHLKDASLEDYYDTILLSFLIAAPVAAKDTALQMVSIDVEGGGGTLFVTPEGKSLLIDTGNPEQSRITGSNPSSARIKAAAAVAIGASRQADWGRGRFIPGLRIAAAQ